MECPGAHTLARASRVRRRPLPEHLAPVFRVAEGIEAGVAPDRLRARALDRSVWGMRGITPAATLTDRCALFAKRLRDDASLSHTTAALLYGVPLDHRYERDPRLHFTVPAPARPPHATGVIGHHARLGGDDVRTLHDLRVTSPARTWIDLATMLDLTDLVAAGDALTHCAAPWVGHAELRRAVESYRGRGIRLLRDAVDLLDPGAESRPESRLRVMLAVAGLPRPRINHVLVDTETGKHLRPDLTFERERVVLEYQGDYHRTRQQWRKDMTRRARLEAMGAYVMELNADDLRDPGELVERIARVLRGRR